MSLDDLRQKVDELDNRIVKLIAERMEVTREIGRNKIETGKPIEDRVREQAVLEKIKELASSEKLNADIIEKIYQRIFEGSKKLQGVTVAFQGEMGAYSEEAAYDYFGTEARLSPYESLEEYFKL
jgi:chorismate mutase/prephenate dehydratase